MNISRILNLIRFKTKNLLKTQSLPSCLPSKKTIPSDQKDLLEGKITITLLNNAFFISEEPRMSKTIVTPKERWAYALEFSFKETPRESHVLKLAFKVQGEVGILSVDSSGKSLEERIFSESLSTTTYYIDCTQENFHRLFLRNTSPYGFSCVELISVDFCSSNLGKITSFPGFDDFKISKEDLHFWSDYYGSRASSEGQFLRSSWLKMQTSEIEILWQNGIQFCLDSKSNLTRALVVSGYYEPFELSTFEFLASFSKTIIDIGANIGIFSISAAVTNPSSLVYAIEPSNRECGFLKKNKKLNSLLNLEILNIALGEIDGEILLSIAPEELAGHNRIFTDPAPELKKNSWISQKTTCRKLDSLRLKHTLKIDLVKIDVEGHELSILKGCLETLTNDKPHILLELQGGLWSNSIHAIQVAELLQNSGYKIFDLDHKLGIWRNFSGWRSENSGNLLCIHDSKKEILFDINCHLIKAFDKTSTPKYSLQSVDIKSLNPIDVFCHSSALAINEARLAHLDSLGLNLAGKKVLEVGGGIGLHTPYFLSLGCRVTFTDSRKENLEIAKTRLKSLAEIEELDLDTTKDLGLFQTDVVYCYGVLYHLANPAHALSALASTNANTILLETCVNRTQSSSEIDFEKENSENPNQSSSGLGARPTRTWVANELKKHWKYVYFTTSQPTYPDFPENWLLINAANTRTIFIGSNERIFSPFLISYFPNIQRELEITYLKVFFNSFEEASLWIQSLPTETRFMIAISQQLPTEIGSILNLFPKNIALTTLSPCLNKTTLVCGRIKNQTSKSSNTIP